MLINVDSWWTCGSCFGLSPSTPLTLAYWTRRLAKHSRTLESVSTSSMTTSSLKSVSQLASEKGLFKCYVTLCSWKFDPHPPHRNANNVEPYTFITLFYGKYKQCTTVLSVLSMHNCTFSLVNSQLYFQSCQFTAVLSVLSMHNCTFSLVNAQLYFQSC